MLAVGYVNFSVISVICVISVMGELHLPRLRGAVGLIADTSWREYGIEVFHDFPGQLVGQNAFNISNRKQFGGCALPLFPQCRSEKSKTNRQ